MAYVTPIGSDPAQVEYRLSEAHGCVTAEVADVQFSYHADGGERPLVWTGSGLVEVGITPGTELTEDQFDAVRALMRGADPRTGEQLVAPKLAVYEDAKVPLTPLVRAIRAAAEEADVDPRAWVEGLSSPKMAGVYARAARAVAVKGEGARLRADEAGALADAAGLDVGELWGEPEYATAVGNLTTVQEVTAPDGTVSERIVPRRRVVGNFGYDVSFTLPKSHSLLLAFAEEGTAAAVERVYTEQVGATFDWLEKQTAYGMRGKHGDGKTAETIPGSGFLGWSMVHRAARPVEGRAVGDPHWHVHVTIANMTRGQDGEWSTVAAGGRDLMRHAPAADHVLKALIRRQLVEQFGVQFTRSQRTGAWEVAAIPDETLRAFSKRGASIAAMLRDLGFDPEQATRKAEDLAAAQTRHGKGHATHAPDTTLRSLWQDEARELGVDPDALAAAALPGPLAAGRGAVGTDDGHAVAEPYIEDETTAADDDNQHQGADDGEPSSSSEHESESEEEQLLRRVVARLLDPDEGLTSSRRRFTRVDALAAVADAMPDGASDVDEIEALTDRVLEHAAVIALPAPPAAQERSAVQVPAAAEGPVPTAGVQQVPGERRQLGAGHMRNAARYTTADVVAAERVILARAGASDEVQGVAVVSSTAAVMARSTVEAAQGFELSEEQARVMLRLVTGGRAIEAVEGPPGTGKTTLMRAARVAWEAEGHVVAGAATAAVAAQNLATESGIESRTVAQWVWAIRDAAQARACIENGYVPSSGGPAVEGAERERVDRAARFGGLVGVDVLVLDEANLTDDRDRAVLYREAERTGTKLVEVGDPQQLRGVGCGSLFGRVHELVGGERLTVNRRQRDEDERTAIAAWRSGEYRQALTSWSDRGRLVATETGDQALTAMVATWMTQRQGAPDPHAEMRGVVMLAATNASVDRLNDAAQAVRAAAGELGEEHAYDVRAGRTVRLRQGDHVLIRLNDRMQRMHTGPDVLNGYRGVVEDIDGDGTVHVAWQQQTDADPVTHCAQLAPEFIAKGGVSLGYAITGHKAEGLTVGADWTRPDGEHQGGTVLVYAPGMDEPGMHVATSRHRDLMVMFGGRDQLEDRNTTYERGVPSTEEELTARVITALTAQAATTDTNANDRPVLDDLAAASRRAAAAARSGGGDARRPGGARPVPSSTQQERWQQLREQLARHDRQEEPEPARMPAEEMYHQTGVALTDQPDADDPVTQRRAEPTKGDRPMSRYSFTVARDGDVSADQEGAVDVDRDDELDVQPQDEAARARQPDQQRWHVGWDEGTGTYFAQVEPLPLTPQQATGNTGDGDPLVDVAGTRPSEIRTLRELEERLAGRVQLPDDVRARLAADALARTSVRAGAAPVAAGRPGADAEGGEDEDELLRRWAALRRDEEEPAVRPAAGARGSDQGDDLGTDHSDDEAARRRDDEARRREQHRGPRL